MVFRSSAKYSCLALVVWSPKVRLLFFCFWTVILKLGIGNLASLKVARSLTGVGLVLRLPQSIADPRRLTPLGRLFLFRARRAHALGVSQKGFPAMIPISLCVDDSLKLIEESYRNDPRKILQQFRKSIEECQIAIAGA